MVAKFKLNNTENFWDNIYQPLGRDELLPKKDKVRSLLERLKPLHSKSKNHNDEDEE